MAESFWKRLERRLGPPPPEKAPQPAGIPMSEVVLGPEAALQQVVTKLSHSAMTGAEFTNRGQFREPILQMTSRLPGFGAVHETQQLLWHAMRQYSPTLNSAIMNRRTLEGRPEVTSKDEGLVRRLNDFAEAVPVGYLGGVATLRGLATYLDHISSSADEYGMAAGELLLSEDARQIERLVVPSVRTLTIADLDGDEIFELYQNRKVGGRERIDDKPTVQVLSFNDPVEGPWPPPLVWSATKGSEAALRIVESITNAWYRFGDPTMLLGHSFDQEAQPKTIATSYKKEDGSTETVEVPFSLFAFKQGYETVMQNRKQGIPGDVFTYIQGGEIINEVIGDVDSALMQYFRDQSSVFDAQVVGLSETPVWMYPWIKPGRGEGLGGNLANAEALIYSVAAQKRNVKRRRLAREILDLFLILDGSPGSLGNYEIEFSCANILDAEAEASVRLREAEAVAKEVDNIVQLFEADGKRRWGGEAEKDLEGAGIYAATNAAA